MNVVFADPRWGSALEDSFRKDCGLSVPVTLGSWSARPWWQRWTERVCYMFRKFL